MSSEQGGPSAAEIGRHYDRLGHFYREIWGARVHHGLWEPGVRTREQALDAMEQLIMRELAVQPGWRVCEAGFGYGELAWKLWNEGTAVTALTVSQEQYHVALTRAMQQPMSPHFVLADWLEWKPPPEPGDAVVAVESFEHMAPRSRAFAQAARALRPGGRLVVTGWLAGSRKSAPGGIARAACMAPLQNREEYESMAVEAGFRLERFQDLTAGVRRTWPAMLWQFFCHALRHPAALRYLSWSWRENWRFGWTAARIWLAFGTGRLRYGVFTFVRENPAPHP